MLYRLGSRNCKRYIKELGLVNKYSLQDNILVGNCPLCHSENTFLVTFTNPTPWGHCHKCLGSDAISYIIDGVTKHRHPQAYKDLFKQASKAYFDRKGPSHLYSRYRLGEGMEMKLRGTLFGICNATDLTPLTTNAHMNGVHPFDAGALKRKPKTLLIIPVQRVPGMITGFVIWNGFIETLIPLMNIQYTDRIYLQMPAEAEKHREYKDLKDMLSEEHIMEHFFDPCSIISAPITTYLKATLAAVAAAAAT